MNTKVVKWGNSLGLRIPKALAAETGIEAGTSVDVTARDGELVVRPARPRFALADLLRGVTADNVHGEIETGDPEGRESW